MIHNNSMLKKRCSSPKWTIDALKISLWSAETPQAHIALGDAYLQAKDVQAARGEADRALALAPGSVEARGLLERIDGR